VQELLPNDRSFDTWDVVANVIGSLAATGLCSAYARRAAERRRKAKFSALLGEDVGEDLELGEGPGLSGQANGDLGGQETGVVRTVEEELDNWDENAVDEWDEEEDGDGKKVTPATSTTASDGQGVESSKKMAVD
jgi:hypothetical protein